LRFGPFLQQHVVPHLAQPPERAGGAAGYSMEQLAGEIPGVTVEQPRGAVDFAAEVMGQDVGA